MRKDHFTEEALRNAQALAELKYSENLEDQLAFAEAYDFARCQRPDGSFYGTAGQCRKGSPAGAKKKAERREPEKTKVANSAPKKPEIKPDFRKDIETGAKIRRERDAAIEKLQGRQMRLRKAYAKANQDAAAAIRAKDPARAEKAKARAEKLGEALDSVNDMVRKYTGNRGNTGGRTPSDDKVFRDNFSEEARDALDFARCQRPDGSFYGTAGQCRKGSPAGAKQEESKPKKKLDKGEREGKAAEALKRIAASGPETKVKKESYSWGDLVTVSKGNEYKAVLHPEQQAILKKLKEGESRSFTDEQNVKWKATREGDTLRLSSNRGKLEMGRGRLDTEKSKSTQVPKRNPAEDVRRKDGTLIGTSPRNMRIDTRNELVKERDDYRKKFGGSSDEMVKKVLAMYEKRIELADKWIDKADQ